MSSRVAGLKGAFYVFATAWSLTVLASEALVFGVARVAAGTGTTGVHGAARAFALSADGLMACACLEGTILLGVAFVATRVEGAECVRRLRLGRSRATAVGTAAAVAALVGLGLACGAAVELAGLGGDGVMDLLGRALYRPSPGRLALAFVTIAVVPAIGEEALFRGVLQTRLGEPLGRWPAIIVSAGAFAVFHRDPVQGTVAFLAGLFLGWTADRLGGLRPAIAAHAVNNATFVGLASLGAAGTLSMHARIASLAAGGAVFAAGVAVLSRAPLARVSP